MVDKKYIDEKYKYRNLNKESVVIDIGGYRGKWGFHIADKYGCNVYMFEPSWKNYMSIMFNRLRHNKINLHRMAVSEVDGKINFFLTSHSDGHSIFDRSMLKGKFKHITKKVNIKSITLDSFMTKYNIENVEIIKLNCEGAEIPIIKSIDKNLAKRINQITFSAHVPKITSIEDHNASIVHLKNLGYTVEEYSTDKFSGRYYCYW